jgi:hypothetical protein
MKKQGTPCTRQVFELGNQETVGPAKLGTLEETGNTFESEGKKKKHHAVPESSSGSQEFLPQNKNSSFPAFLTSSGELGVVSRDENGDGIGQGRFLAFAERRCA